MKILKRTFLSALILLTPLTAQSMPSYLDAEQKDPMEYKLKARQYTDKELQESRDLYRKKDLMSKEGNAVRYSIAINTIQDSMSEDAEKIVIDNLHISMYFGHIDSVLMLASNNILGNGLGYFKITNYLIEEAGKKCSTCRSKIDEGYKQADKVKISDAEEAFNNWLQLYQIVVSVEGTPSFLDKTITDPREYKIKPPIFTHEDLKPNVDMFQLANSTAYYEAGNRERYAVANIMWQEDDHKMRKMAESLWFNSIEFGDIDSILRLAMIEKHRDGSYKESSYSKYMIANHLIEASGYRCTTCVDKAKFLKISQLDKRFLAEVERQFKEWEKNYERNQNVSDLNKQFRATANRSRGVNRFLKDSNN